ncbi:MAG: class 3 adenylate cyclase/predicted ATPase [Parasphingorhabdus sp.]|jgi:predicted ATPase/class 3 adenylate cyclase
MQDVSEWLVSLNLAQYSGDFEQNDINLGLLPHLTSDDLKEIGVSSVGHRRTLLEAIKTLPENNAGLVDEPALSDTLTPGRVIEAERRQIAIMFCDLVGSTALSQSLDAEELRDVLQAYQDAVSSAIVRFEGHVAKYLGDGVLAYFGWPTAYEDQADRAVRAGLAAISAVAKLKLDTNQKLSSRVGIATGQVVIGDLVSESGRDAEAVTGETPNLAARLQDLADNDQVMIDANTVRLIGTAFKLEDIGKHSLKGFHVPVSVWRVAGENEVTSRFKMTRPAKLAPFIGRQHELGLLLDGWSLAKAGEGQTVELCGEAGIGKSRMIQALFDTVNEDQKYWLHYQCSPHHTNSAYFPIIQRLEAAARFAHTDNVETRLDKLETLLGYLGQEIQVNAPLFAALMSLPGDKRYGKLDLTPEQLRVNISKALMDQVLNLVSTRPILVVFEDTHWIDPTTQEFLDQLASRIGNTSVLMISTYRTRSIRSQAPISNLTSITLNRLSRSQGRKIIEGTGRVVIQDDVIDQIISRSDGVPLYIEELTRTIEEAGVEASSTDIPESLQASLTARLDRLGDVREILQIGAIIGRDFRHDLLATLLNWPEQKMLDTVEQMLASELVFQHGVAADITYTFKHALVQDAAYQSLLKRTRRKLHQQVAELIEHRFPEIIHTQPELLAHHYAEAGLLEKSANYWYKAGQRAIEHSANLEAIVHLTNGQSLLLKQPESANRDTQELNFCLALGPTFMSTKGLASPEAEQVYSRAKQLCEHMTDAALSFQAAWGLWLVYQQRGKIEQAQSASDEVLSLAEQQSKNIDHQLQAHHAAWTTQLFIGNNSKSRFHTLQGDALYDIEKHRNHAFHYGGHDPGVCAKTTASEALCLMGFADQAVQLAVEGLSLAKKLSHPFTLAMAHYFIAQIHQYRQEAELVRTNAQVTITLCESHGFESFRAQAAVLMGWATAAEGDCERGIEQIHAGLKDWQSTGTGMRRPYFLALLADALLRGNRAAEAINVVDEAETLIQQSSETRWLAETVRLKAMLLERTESSSIEIEKTYLRALAIAKEQEARWLHIRTATSLARYWSNQGRIAEAQDLLSPLYLWFTEGFSTIDLVETSTLLDELS